MRLQDRAVATLSDYGFQLATRFTELLEKHGVEEKESRQSFVVPRIRTRSALKTQTTPEHRYCKNILPHSRVPTHLRSASLESGRQLVTR